MFQDLKLAQLCNSIWCQVNIVKNESVNVHCLVKFYISTPVFTCSVAFHMEHFKIAREKLIESTIAQQLKAKKLINCFRLVRKVHPLTVPADNNSLCHSCAIYVCGVPDQRQRVRKALESTLLDNASRHSLFYCRWKTSLLRNCKDMENSVSEDELECEWRRVLLTGESKISETQSSFPADKPFFKVSLHFLVFVLSHVCRRPIIVIADEFTDGVNSGIFLPLLLSARDCIKCPIYLAYHEDKFVPLVFEDRNSSAESSIHDLLVPLMNDQCETLQVHFLLHEEESDQLLEKYLFVTKIGRATASGIDQVLSARIPGEAYAKSVVNTGVDPRLTLRKCFDPLSLGADPHEVYQRWFFVLSLSLPEDSETSTGESAAHSAKLESLCHQAIDDDDAVPTTGHLMNIQSAREVPSCMSGEDSSYTSCTSDLDLTPSVANHLSGKFPNPGTGSDVRRSIDANNESLVTRVDATAKSLRSLVGDDHATSAGLTMTDHPSHEEHADQRTPSVETAQSRCSLIGETSRNLSSSRSQSTNFPSLTLDPVETSVFAENVPGPSARVRSNIRDLNVARGAASNLSDSGRGSSSDASSGSKKLKIFAKDPETISGHAATYVKEEVDESDVAHFAKRNPRREISVAASHASRHSSANSSSSRHYNDSCSTDGSSGSALFQRTPVEAAGTVTKSRVGPTPKASPARTPAPTNSSVVGQISGNKIVISGCDSFIGPLRSTLRCADATATSTRNAEEKVSICLALSDKSVDYSSTKQIELKVSARPTVSRRIARTSNHVINIELLSSYGEYVLDMNLPTYVIVEDAEKRDWDFSLSSMLDIDDAEGLQVTHDRNPAKCKTAGCMYLGHPGKLNLCQGCFEAYKSHVGTLGLASMYRRKAAHSSREGRCIITTCDNPASPGCRGFCEACYSSTNS